MAPLFRKSYRLVYFVPDPFLGGRIPIAALVEEEGAVQVVRMPRLPCPDCLGGAAAASIVKMSLMDLEEVTALDERPEGLGPQVEIGEAREVPAGAGRENRRRKKRKAKAVTDLSLSGARASRRTT